MFGYIFRVIFSMFFAVISTSGIFAASDAKIICAPIVFCFFSVVTHILESHQRLRSKALQNQRATPTNRQREMRQENP